MTPLCDIAYKYRTDKCPQLGHSFTPFYYELLKDKRNSIKKVLEIGIGYPAVMKHCPGYVTGASLYMWRDFFPNAQIYGADIEPETIFEAERIKTFLFDETKKENIEGLIKKTGSDIDLFIDDGKHYVGIQAFLCKTVMPLLKKDVIYVIEDLFLTHRIVKLLPEFDLEFPRFVMENNHCGKLHGKLRYRDNLVIVKNRKK